MHGKEEDAGILPYFKDDDTAMCNYARRTCLVICLVCYRTVLDFAASILLYSDNGILESEGVL